MQSILIGLWTFLRHGAVRHNNEYWYFDRKSIVKRIRLWFIWVGGWEMANSEGWEVRRWSYGEGMRLKDPTPISVFGHRITFFGNWLQIKRYKRGHITIAWGPHRHYAYISHDGTPSNAHYWFWGAPRDVIAAANQHAIEYAQRKQERAEQEAMWRREAEAAIAARKVTTA